MVASGNNFVGHFEATWTLDADGQTAITVPDSQLLFKGEYSRIGPDLVISDDIGQSLRINNYFDTEATATLISPNGGQLDGHVVNTLAGPLYPGQYAQVGTADGREAIGQVETLQVGAKVQRADGSIEDLTVGTKVFQNDVVSTAEGGKLSITVISATHVPWFPASSVTITFTN